MRRRTLIANKNCVSDQIFGPTCKILVKKATNLKNVLKFGTIDPYAEVTFESKYEGEGI